MKKLLALILAAALALSLAACGGGSGETDTETPGAGTGDAAPSETPGEGGEDQAVDKNSTDAYIGIWESESGSMRLTVDRGGIGEYEFVPLEEQYPFSYEVVDGVLTITMSGVLSGDLLSSFELNDDGTVLTVLREELPTTTDETQLMKQVPSGEEDTAVPAPTDPSETEEAGETGLVTVNGICVDNSYEDSDGAPLKMVYLLYTLTAADTNMKIDSNYMEMTINGKNSYTSEGYADKASAAKFMPNYYYSSYIKDVYIGTTIQVAATFKVPEGDLAAGRTITLSDSQIPGIEALRLSTDDIQYFDSGEELAAAMDPDGYAQILVSREEADAERTAFVKNYVNGRYWAVYVNNIAYKISFSADNNFVVTTALGSNQGTYSVRNDYLFCTYPDTGYVIEIHYEIVDDTVDLDVTEAFDVRD